MKVYKIRDRETGLYSTGGSGPRWEKIGKFWHNLRSVKMHLRLALHYAKMYDTHVYDNSVVIEYDILPTKTFAIEEIMPQ